MEVLEFKNKFSSYLKARDMHTLKLEEVLKHYFFRLVRIELCSGTLFQCYLVGIRLPVGKLLMLYWVNEKHIEKYIKHGNSRWLEMIS